MGVAVWIAILARRWVARAPMPTSLAQIYHGLRVMNAVLLATSLVGICMLFPTDVLVIITVSIMRLFAVVEYINYYVVRLS